MHSVASKPLVSVVIPSYNHRTFVGEAIESLLMSSVEDWEAVIVDDGSTDGSVEFIKQIKDPRIRLFSQPNRGAHHAINRGVSLAKAPWIAVLNSDDRFHQSKLERHLEIHERNPQYEASASLVRYVSEKGTPVAAGSYLAWNYRRMRKTYEEHDSLFASLLAGNHLITSSSLFIKKTVFQEIGGLIPLRYNHDWFMFLTLALRRRCLVLEEDLCDYRRHPANTIAEGQDAGRVEANFVLEWHLFKNSELGDSVLDPQQASLAVARNPGVCYQLLLLFQAWRQVNGNDLRKSTSLFERFDHPVRQLALRILREERPLLDIRRFLKRAMGLQRAMRLADCALKAYRVMTDAFPRALKP